MQIKGFCKKEGVGAVFEDIYLVSGKRTPFGKLNGTLSSVSPTDLGILSSRAAIAASGIPANEIDQTIVANIGQSSADSFFLPRHISLYSGVRTEAPALLVQRICGSGIEAIGKAAEEIALGKARVVLACGTETMSRFPLVSYGMRQGFQLGKPDFIDLLWEALGDTAAVPMGHTADNLAKKYKLTRQEVDEFSKQSQDRYFQACNDGFFKDELIGVESKNNLETPGLKPRSYRTRAREIFSQDENPRKTTLEDLAKLPYIFTKEGPTTAGSACGIVDGACSVLLASKEFVSTHGLKVLGKIRGIASVGVDPYLMGIGPAPAIRLLLSQCNYSTNDINLFEINEAFSAQCLAVTRDLELDLNKVNIHGGAIAMGHPLAASGCRLVLTGFISLKKSSQRLAVASACIGGGQGVAMLIEAT
ncbi:MAG: thiolase family protein [Bdellovibrio sp.]|nr:thiolase family protein [Bdellovibrio sp.]